MTIQHFWKFYIPILLFDEQRFKKKIGLLSPFWKFEFFNKLSTLYPPNWIESLYRRSWNFIHMLKVRWYNFWVTYKAIERFFFWTGLINISKDTIFIYLDNTVQWKCHNLIPLASHSPLTSFLFYIFPS